MKFPIWFIPIIIVTIMLPLTTGKKKPWDKLTKKEKKEKIILVVIGIILLMVGILTLALVRFNQNNL